MTTKPLVILGSARKSSDTRSFVEAVFANTEYNLADLLDYTILPYNYQSYYPDEDQFLEVVAEVMPHQVLIFATPVYWYAMSGLMETFFDRITDITTTHKQLGRQLKGKRVFLLAVGEEKELPPGFEVPFSFTAAYLDMTYETSIYYSSKYATLTALHNQIENFLNKVKSAQ